MPACLPSVASPALLALNRLALRQRWAFLSLWRWWWLGGLWFWVLSSVNPLVAETPPKFIPPSDVRTFPSELAPSFPSSPAVTAEPGPELRVTSSAPAEGPPLPPAASEGASTSPVSTEVSALTRLAEEARLEGSYARAVQLLDEASLLEPEPLARWKLSYQSAMMKANVPGASLDAAHALEQLLRSSPPGVPARLWEVAHAEVLRLQGFAAHGEVYQEVLRLREALLRLPMADRLSWLVAQEQSRPEPLLERARLQLLMETHWERGEWRDVRRTLERIAELEGAWKPALLELHARARQEIRRQRLAWASTTLLLVAIFALPWSLRGLPERQRLLRQVLLALTQWGLMLLLLYLYYVLGRQRGDVSPVTLPKLLVLFVLTGGAQALGLVWRRVLQERLTSGEARGLGFLLAVLFPVAGLYLFAYHFDYASVLNL